VFNQAGDGQAHRRSAHRAEAGSMTGFTDDDPRGASYPPGDPSAWYHLAYSDEVSARAPLAVDALGEHFVLFRQPDGSVSALDGYCPHLGADLAAGCVAYGTIECPFHRWRFTGDGKLCHVPAGGKVPPGITARRFPVVEAGGIVFGWRAHGAGPAAPAWDDPAGGPLHGLRQVGRRVVDGVRIHVLEMAENTVDNQHFVPLHGQMFVPFTRFSVPGVRVLHETTWERDPERPWVVRFTDDARLTFRGRPIPRTGASASVSFVGPGALVRIDFAIPDVGTVTLLQTQTPLSPMRQRVAFTWYAGEGVPSLFASYVVGSWYSQWLVDVAIWERKIYRHKPQLVAADGPVHALRRWYRQFYPGAVEDAA
jgi:cholesterol 7-desaturase